MKRIAILTLLAAAVAAQAQPVPLQQPQPFLDNARVRSVQPQYQNVQVPRQECRSEWVTEAQPAPAQNNVGGIAIGAIVGGVLGNQVGKGHGREAATVAGAVAGGMVGNNVAGSNQQPQPVAGQREVRNCRQVVDVQQRATGYLRDLRIPRPRVRDRDAQPAGPQPAGAVSVTPVEAEYHRRN
jgi:uncharacterized protein YcfJ